MRYAILLSLSILALSQGACTVEEAHAEEHAHTCRAVSDVPSYHRCCRLREGDRCTLWGKTACTTRGCDCGYVCGVACTGCVAE